MATASLLSQGTVLAIESATPSTFIDIAEITDWDGLGGGEASDIDATSLDSTAKEFRIGLMDAGSVTLSMFWLPHDEGQKMLASSQVAQSIKNFKVTFNESLDSGITTPTVATFQAGVKSFPGMGGSVDDIVRGSATLRITGEITFTEGT